MGDHKRQFRSLPKEREPDNQLQGLYLDETQSVDTYIHLSLILTIWGIVVTFVLFFIQHQTLLIKLTVVILLVLVLNTTLVLVNLIKKRSVRPPGEKR